MASPATKTVPYSESPEATARPTAAPSGPATSAIGLRLLLRELAGQANQRLELVARRAAVDRVGRQLRPLLEVARAPTRHQRGPRVHQHDLAPRAGLSGQDAPDDLGVLLAVTAAEV